MFADWSQTDAVPLILPALRGKWLIVIGSLTESPAPQELTPFTDSIPAVTVLQ
jgi:hypothetical protein